VFHFLYPSIISEISSKAIIKATLKEKKNKTKSSPKVILVTNIKKSLKEKSSNIRKIVKVEDEEEPPITGIKARLQMETTKKAESKIQLYRPPSLKSSGEF
jgi:hypothetical protein